jgi:ferredoxin
MLPFMSTRKIISINHDRCNGCGQCIPNCPEGALQVIDGKARLVSDLFCDGLGACLGHCPEGAIEIIEREAEPYDERTVTAAMRIPVPAEIVSLRQDARGTAAAGRLDNWPIQLHLLSPLAPTLAGKDMLLCADCVAFAVPDFQEKLLKGKALAIACPKLDEGKDVYRDKIIAMIDKARINTLTVVMMEVPCCRGLLGIAREAASRAQRTVPLKAVIVAIENGETLAEEWV